MNDEKVVISIDDFECHIEMNFTDKKCNVDCKMNIGLLKKVSQIIKDVFKLI